MFVLCLGRDTLVVRGLVGGVVLLYAVIEYPNISFNLESEHFSPTSGGLYSLVGSGDGGGGDSTVHEMVLVIPMLVKSVWSVCGLEWCFH